MSKNLIPEICKMLGVELGEEFKIKGYDDSNTRTYKFTVQGLRVKLVEHPEATEFNALVALNSLLVGDAEIIKLPWKPKEDTEVYTFSFTTHEYNSRFCPHKGVWYVTKWNWAGFPWQIAALDKGWVYRTRKEAEAALPAVAAEMGVDYEL